MATATAITLPTSPRGYYLRSSEVYVPLEEYLRSTYDPDMDYVDGHLEERNLGDFDHADLQTALLTVLRQNARKWNVYVLGECRLQVKADRFRVPDIMVIARGEKPDRIVREAPLLCIEVLSPDDTIRRILFRVDDYAEMGVKNIWVLDPGTGRVFTAVNGERRWTEERVLSVEGTEIRVNLDAIAADLAE